MKTRRIHLLLVLALAAPLALAACQTHDSSGDEHAGEAANGDEHAGDSAE